MINRLRLVSMIAACFAVLAVSGVAHAATKVTIGYTPVTANLGAYVAVDEGFFAKHGIDAKMVQIPIGTDIPAALISNSIQVGAPTPTVVLQANDAGLDLVLLTATSVFPNPDPGGLVARFGSNIKKAGRRRRQAGWRTRPQRLLARDVPPLPKAPGSR